jgi:hypothetical protein
VRPPAGHGLFQVPERKLRHQHISDNCEDGGGVAAVSLTASMISGCIYSPRTDSWQRGPRLPISRSL